MSFRRDPRRVVERLGLGAVGFLVAVGIGTGAASYAVSGVDPFYFNGGSSLRSHQPLSDRASAADNMTSTSDTFPSVPGDQYYYYRPPPVTASYDAHPSYTASTEPLPDRAYKEQIDSGGDEVETIDDATNSDAGNVRSAVDSEDEITRGDDLTFRVVPDPVE
jgi:hypothetical protein